MQFKLLLKLSLLVFILIGFAVSPASLLADIKSDNKSNLRLPVGLVDKWSQPYLIPLASNSIPIFIQVDKQAEIPSWPIRIKIPKIKVDIELENVGLTVAGAVDTPKDFARAAWFNKSPKPGEIGSAIITGHYGRNNNKPSAFDNLHKLETGDKIYIEDDQGAIITFTVRESRLYDQNANAPEVFISNDEKVHLNLITCEGVWNKAQKSYSNRLVVFTDQE